MRIPAYLVALCFAFALPAHAAPGAVEVKSIAEVEVEVVNAKGKKELKRQPVEKAVPGTEVIYTTTFKNLVTKPVGNIALTNPIPNNTTYKAGSASGVNTDITYSLNGKDYAPLDALKVKGKDGKERAALPAEISHIRWTYRGDLPVGKTGEISFRTVIK
ncbi:MAG: hypothetical protein ABL877_02505 [Thiobacillus sp.]